MAPIFPCDAGRRTVVQSLLGAALASSLPLAFAQAQRAGNEGRLVLVFLRGAYDGLSALVPHGDADYYRIRPSVAIPRPDGTNQTALALDTQFAMHPAMDVLMPLWRQGVLAAIPAAGSPDPTRSHFDAQHHWETGVPGKSSNASGWLNTAAAQLAMQGSRGQPQDTGSVALGVGESNPAILAGPSSVRLVPKGQAATRTGALADARAKEALMRMYDGQDALSQAFRAGAQSRQETAAMLSDASASATMDGREMQAANNGAGPAQGLLLDAQHLGTLMRQDRAIRIGFLSAGGWDTHANQGAVTGALANNLKSLAQALVQLRRDFSRPRDVVVVCSEFGRTSAENGTRGTDHGHGNTLWLMGDQVQGGRWHGRWDGLATGNLHEGRDLPVHHDFRAVLAHVLRASLGLNASQLDALFPGFAWDASLDGLMHS